MKDLPTHVGDGIATYIKEKYNSIIGPNQKDFKWCRKEVVLGLLYLYTFYKKNDGDTLQTETSKLIFH